MEKLKNGYELRIMDEAPFFEEFRKWKDKVFDEDHSLFPGEYLSPSELENTKNLRTSLYNQPYNLYIGVFCPDGHFVGWHLGYQESAHVFYMCNSAILDDHRRKGLYSNLLKFTLDHLKQKGFQVIYSRHNATNNSVIIPKLKAGFIISSLEMDDVFGVLVHLKYYTNETRRKIMDYRAGQKKPDDQLKKLFKL